MERYVECESRGLTLRGMLHVPDQRPGKVPFVILFHGFCDDRNEINFVHTELSRRLCERGIASVRFDFAGSGDSDGRFEDMTVSGEVEDGLAILDYVKSLDFVDQSRIAIHGLSMGGCVASMVAGLRDADVCALSLCTRCSAAWMCLTSRRRATQTTKACGWAWASIRMPWIWILTPWRPNSPSV